MSKNKRWVAFLPNEEKMFRMYPISTVQRDVVMEAEAWACGIADVIDRPVLLAIDGPSGMSAGGNITDSMERNYVGLSKR